MQTVPIELEVARSGAVADRHALAVYQVAGGLLALAGGFGWFMAEQGESGRARRRAARFGSLLAVAGGAAGVARPPEFAQLWRERLNPWVAPAVGLAALAATGGHDSPMLIPSQGLAVMGGALLGPSDLRRGGRRASLMLGAATGGGYLAVSLVSGRAWRRPVDPGLAWNVANVSNYVVAALIGGELGDLAVWVRRLQHQRARDREQLARAGYIPEPAAGTRALRALRRGFARLRGRRSAPGAGQLERIARELGECVRELEAALLQISDHARGTLNDQSVVSAVERVRREIQHHELAPLLIAAARGDPADLGLALRSVAGIYAAAGRRTELRFKIPDGLSVSARATAVLIRVLKVALDNSTNAGATSVEIAAGADGTTIELAVDDHGTRPREVREAAYGTGLSEARDTVRSLGGSLSVDPGDDGMRFRARLPSTPAPAPAPTHSSLLSRVDQSLDAIDGMLALQAVWATGVSPLSAGRRTVLASGAAALLAAVDAGVRRQAPDSLARSLLSAALSSAIWPKGGLPASDWTAFELYYWTRRGPLGQVPLVLAAGAAGRALAVRHVRGSVAADRITENLVWPYVGAAGGVIARVGRWYLDRLDRETLTLRERADLVDSLAHAGTLHHELTQRITGSSAWYEAGIVRTPAGQQLTRQERIFTGLRDQIVSRVVAPDPIADLQSQLQVRLDPAEVTVSGVRPRYPNRRLEEQATSRVRHQVALINTIDTIADDILARYPPSLAGRSSLDRVHIHITALDADSVRLHLQPIPPAVAGGSDKRLLVGALADLGGELLEGFDDGGLACRLPGLALA